MHTLASKTETSIPNHRMLFKSCGVRPAPVRPFTALLYRRMGSLDMVNPGSIQREFLDAYVWEAELRRRNFTVTSVTVPDDFCTQVRTWASGYQVITSPHGAQLLVAMAASEGARIVEFFPDRFKSYLYCRHVHALIVLTSTFLPF